MSLTIAIVGRPNVGKSTLFNRLAGKRLAIVDDTPGVTRDRRMGEGRIADLRFSIFDTAGFEDASNSTLEGRMREQTDKAIQDADVALFLIDARAGVTPLDNHFADWIRSRNIPVILLANKCEGRSGEAGLYDSYSLGLGDPLPFSAEHGEGLGELYDVLRPYADDYAEMEREPEPNVDIELEDDDHSGPIQMAIVGRPNVGKSTLINKLIGDDRLLTGPEAGITRDAIAVEWSYQGRQLKLIDTAGMRRKGKVTDKIERLSTQDSNRAIQYAQLVVLVLDSNDMLEKQDLTIARQVIEEGRVLIIAANKWDIVKDRKAAKEKLNDRLLTSLPQVRGVPVLNISALTGKGLEKLLPTAFEVFETWNKRVSTGQLNQWLEHMTQRHPPPITSGRRLRLRYITQAKSRPPTFIVFCSKGVALPEAYRRYLINGLRDDFGLVGIPIRLLVRKGANPYVDK